MKSCVTFESCQDKCKEMNKHIEFEKRDNILVNVSSKTIDDSVSVNGGDNKTDEFPEVHPLEIGRKVKKRKICRQSQRNLYPEKIYSVFELPNE